MHKCKTLRNSLGTHRVLRIVVNIILMIPTLITILFVSLNTLLAGNPLLSSFGTRLFYFFFFCFLSLILKHLLKFIEVVRICVHAFQRLTVSIHSA